MIGSGEVTIVDAGYASRSNIVEAEFDRSTMSSSMR